MLDDVTHNFPALYIFSYSAFLVHVQIKYQTIAMCVLFYPVGPIREWEAQMCGYHGDPCTLPAAAFVKTLLLVLFCFWTVLDSILKKFPPQWHYLLTLMSCQMLDFVSGWLKRSDTPEHVCMITSYKKLTYLALQLCIFCSICP